MDPDLELLERWRAGDTHAGGELYQRHFIAVSAYFSTRLPAAQEDLIQETFLGMVKSRDRFEGRSTFRTYLFSIAQNVFREAIRKKTRLAQTFDPLVDSVADANGRSQSSIVAQDQALQTLLDAMIQISSVSQDILELHYFQDLTAIEIAEIVGIPHNTVKSRLHSARKQLLQRYVELSSTTGSTWGDTEIHNGLRSVRELVRRGGARA